MARDYGADIISVYEAPDDLADAEHLDVLREPRSILTFSHGNHHCLGAAAARMQARVALTELLARYPDFDVDPAGIRWASGNYVRRPDFVPFHPGRHA